MISKIDAASELLKRRAARNNFLEYVKYTRPNFHISYFSQTVCESLDQFILDVEAGLRPILILQAPPQHGKSELVSRKLPAYLMGRFPDWRIAAASYADTLAKAMAQDVRRGIASDAHKILFPSSSTKRPYAINRAGEFSNPNGDGSYIGVGVDGGLTGRGFQIGIIDDPIKGATEALSVTTKESIWNWYQSVFINRAANESGTIIMATSWAQDDLSGRVIAQHAGDPRLKLIRFPAINEPDEAGYNPQLPRGALVPQLHSIEQLKEIKAASSDYWWSAMYQQSPKSLGGNVFKESGVRYYLPKDLPSKYDKYIASWDCTFKDTDGTDYVVGQVWGRSGANSYLLGQVRERMSFTRTVGQVGELRDAHPAIRSILIEDKANGPAVIDVLKSKIPGILPVEPDGSKLARAHAVTSFWEAGNVWLPHPTVYTWVKALVDELTAFPVAPNDDQVDAMTQALRYLYPKNERFRISADAIQAAMTRR